MQEQCRSNAGAMLKIERQLINWLQPYIERQQINGYSPIQRDSKSMVTALYRETANQWLQPYIERQQINGYSHIQRGSKSIVTALYRETPNQQLQHQINQSRRVTALYRERTKSSNPDKLQPYIESPANQAIQTGYSPIQREQQIKQSRQVTALYRERSSLYIGL